MVQNKIRVKCAEAGISQGNLAGQMPDDVNAVAMSFLVAGKVLPTRDGMKKMCDVFSCSPIDIYEPEDIDLLGLANDGKADETDEVEEPKDHLFARPDEKSGHKGMTRFYTWLKPSEKEQLAKAVEALGYRNCAEWFREAYRSAIDRYRQL
jgi:DNA-binding XRE family transcriptional regulator